MKFSILNISAYIVGLLLLLGFIVFYYTTQRGIVISNRLAAISCAKVVNDYLPNNFEIIGVEYEQNYTLTLSKVGLSIRYAPTYIARAECLITTRYRDNMINIKEATLIMSDADTVFIRDLYIQYTP